MMKKIIISWIVVAIVLAGVSAYLLFILGWNNEPGKAIPLMLFLLAALLVPRYLLIRRARKQRRQEIKQHLYQTFVQYKDLYPHMWKDWLEELVSDNTSKADDGRNNTDESKEIDHR